MFDLFSTVNRTILEGRDKCCYPADTGVRLGNASIEQQFPTFFVKRSPTSLPDEIK